MQSLALTPLAIAFVEQTAEVIRRHAIMIFVVAVYCFAAVAGMHLLGVSGQLGLSLYSGSIYTLLAVFTTCFVIGHVIYVMLLRRPEELARTILDDWRYKYFSPERVVSGLLIVVLMAPFVSAYTSIKVMIPLIQSYSWDPTFAAWDRMLHGGVEPWRLLQPLLGTPWVTSGINFLYHLWFFVLFLVVFWQAFSLSDKRLRQQFFLAFMGCWICVGSLAATAFSSVGPVYYAYVTGDGGGFAPLLAYLREANEIAPVWALDVQLRLWSAYESGQSGLGSGISAMPSMHVSMAFLLAMLGWRKGWLLGWSLSLFALAIFIGSVHLGWHYAVDGYLAIAMTWGIWWAAGLWAGRTQGKTVNGG